MKDIQKQHNLYLLVAEFHKKILTDNTISDIFTDAVKIHLEENLPILVTFWSSVLLGTGGYLKKINPNSFRY